MIIKIFLNKIISAFKKPLKTLLSFSISRKILLVLSVVAFICVVILLCTSFFRISTNVPEKIDVESSFIIPDPVNTESAESANTEEVTTSEIIIVEENDDISRDQYGQAIWDTSDSDKVVYLTFDDGPSELTPLFLDVLRQYNVHATFFVVYNPECEEIYKREVKEGHALQVHTATHKYGTIYSSLDAYLDDFWLIHNYIEDTTGVYPMYYRFPGGSTVTRAYSNGLTRKIDSKLSALGFQYVDWSTSTGDGNSKTVSTDMLNNIISGMNYEPNRLVVLAHDSADKNETLKALPEIIEYFISKGYAFGVVSDNIDMSYIQFLRIG